MASTGIQPPAAAAAAAYSEVIIPNQPTHTVAQNDQYTTLRELKAPGSRQATWTKTVVLGELLKKKPINRTVFSETPRRQPEVKKHAH